MKLGYFTLADNAPFYAEHRKDPARLLRDIAEQAVLCDDAGFSSFWVPEHHGPGFGMLPTPGAMLGYIAARTKRIGLGPACVVLPINQPLRVAEEYAVLDQLSGGRIQVAFGRGFDEKEYKGYATSFHHSREALREGIELVNAAWTQRPFTFHGSIYRVEEPFELNQYPVQQPRPEIYVALWSKGTLEMAAELGYSVMFTPFAAGLAFGGLGPAVAQFKALAKSHGHDQPLKTACSYFCAIARNAEDARNHRARLLRLLKGLVPSVPNDRATAPPNLLYFVDIVEKIQAMQIDDLGDGSIATGPAEKVTEVLKRAEAAGIDEVILNVYFGGISQPAALEQLELLGKEVLPHFGQSKVTLAAAG